MSEIRTLADLTHDPKNVRRHNSRNVGMIERALNEVGAARSIVVDENGVVLAGNATIEAAAAAGIERVHVVDGDGQTIIAVRRSGLTPEQKAHLALYDNRTAELAEWDTEALAALGEEVDLSQFWTRDELADLLTIDVEPGGGGDEFDVSLQDGPTRTSYGQLWQLGPHRLLVGDSTKAEDVARLMGGERAVCMWTDPPYGVDYVGKTKDALTIENDGADGLAGLLAAAFECASAIALAEGAAFYIARPPGALSVTFGNAVVGAGWRLHEELQWIKDTMVLGHSDYHLKHETVMFGYLPGSGRRGRGGAGWYGPNNAVSVFEIPRPKASPDHPTGKPVALVEAHLQNSTPRGGLVYEPFAGSGTTVIAAYRLGRVCRAMEVDPKYADVILRRFEAETGQPAERVDA